jgi:hypothetical protein
MVGCDDCRQRVDHACTKSAIGGHPGGKSAILRAVARSVCSISALVSRLFCASISAMTPAMWGAAWLVPSNAL